jgi:hypothetical protein
MATWSTTDTFGPDEWRVLCLLRERYGQGCDLFSAREMARLRFVRWLYHSGRLTSSEDCDGDADSLSGRHAA